jgi:hypothetical protein
MGHEITAVPDDDALPISQTALDKLDGEARDDAKKYLNTILEQRSLIERSASAVERVAQKIGDAK